MGANKTKRVRFYIDLHPGWQDYEGAYHCATTTPAATVSEGNRRVAISVDLPCFGGSLLAADEVQGVIESVNEETV